MVVLLINEVGWLLREWQGVLGSFHMEQQVRMVQPVGSRCLHHCDCPEGAMGEAQEISLESKGLGESLHYSRKRGSVLAPPGKPYTKGFYFCRHTSNLRG